MNADHLNSDPPQFARTELAPGVFIPDADLRFQYARASGPGGQNVNKVNTKAEIWVSLAALMGMTSAAKLRLEALAGHRLTRSGEIHISSDTHRTQESNRSEVLQRLRELILKAQHQPKRRRKTKPTKASKQRRLNTKKIRGQIKSNRRAPQD